MLLTVINRTCTYKLCHGEMSGYWLKLFLIKPEYFNTKFDRLGDPDLDSGFFRWQQKLKLKFILLFANRVIKNTSVFKENKLLRSHNTAEIKVFINDFCLLIEGSGGGSGRPKLRIRI